jgi:hypothetical protein
VFFQHEQEIASIEQSDGFVFRKLVGVCSEGRGCYKDTLHSSLIEDRSIEISHGRDGDRMSISLGLCPSAGAQSDRPGPPDSSYVIATQIFGEV